LEPQEADSWRESLLQGLLPEGEALRKIVGHIGEHANFSFALTIGSIAGREAWGRNKAQVSSLVGKRSLRKSRNFIFPAGNMFWFSRELIEALYELDLEHESFPDEAGQLDGELPHALERAYWFITRGEVLILGDDV
jgi:lipopolysaccharide biosynthesis protein